MNFFLTSYSALHLRTKNTANSLEPTPPIQQEIRSVHTELDEIHKQNIFITIESEIKKLNNGIKEINDYLTQLDNQYINRGKRGASDQIAIVECIQLTEKFKEIYKDLNRISETLSMMDGNGICRCKCPLDNITFNTTTETTRITDEPLDLTTFSLKSTNEQTMLNEKPKQLKKIKVHSYKPTNGELESHTDEEAIIYFNTVNYENDFTTLSMVKDTTTREEIITSTTPETKEDMFPAMSNSVTHFFNYDSYTETDKPQTSYSEDETYSLKDKQVMTSEIPTTSTDNTGSNKVIKTVKLAYDELSTTHKERSNEEIKSIYTTLNGNILESTPETSTLDENSDKSYNPEKQFELTSTNENIFKLTAETLNSYDDYSETSNTKRHFESTTADENISKPTSEVFNSKVKYSDDYTTKIDFELTSEINDLHKLSTKISAESYETSSKPNEGDDFEITSMNKNVLEKPTQSSAFSNYKHYNNDVTENKSELVSANKNTIELTTTTSNFDKNNRNANIRERVSLKNQNTTYSDKFKNDNIVNHSSSDKSPKENENNGSKLNKHDHKSIPNSEIIQEQIQQLKWQPICFYPVPCSPYVLNYQQNTQNTSKSNIQYSAQSLNAYKKKNSPLAGATVIKNNYPIIAYCPVGMVCPMTDFSGQANMLHCMLKSTDPGMSISANKINEDTTTQKIEKTYDGIKFSPAAPPKSKIARDSDEILTGK